MKLSFCYVLFSYFVILIGEGKKSGSFAWFGRVIYSTRCT